ncbi:M23 family metallopeptidase [Pontiellaceae bacterium B12227]|nr:M23 family metallopeptidase [Pontiellaceae bacterium B12227]
MKVYRKSISVSAAVVASTIFLAASAAAFIVHTNDTLYLSWSGESNVSYKVEHKLEMDGIAWSNASPAIIGTGEMVLHPVTNSVGEPFPKQAFFRLDKNYPDAAGSSIQDMLTPVFYSALTNAPFRAEVNRFAYYAGREQFHHPLENPAGEVPSFSAPGWGEFGATKPVRGDPQSYHPASDLYVSSGETNVQLYAAHSGVISVYRDADKYRHYLAISKDLVDVDGVVVGKLSTLYAHIDLDLDEADGLLMNGQTVAKGDLVSQNLYSGTMGGPHLHFEIRYYRAADTGEEEFYGGPLYSEPSSGPWLYGYWDPQVGYGFAHPGNHGLVF